MPIVFLDTNILVYAAIGQETDPAKAKRATEIMAADFCLSAQVLAEFVSVVRRKSEPEFAAADMEVWLDRLARQTVVPLDSAMVRRGAAISAEHGINYYDGAILAAAERLGCDTVLSEDMTDGRAYGGVTVRNPFMEG
jgi:predicted nucleic acid-binding protein